MHIAVIRTKGTVANLRANPAVEVNVGTPFARRGDRCKGAATVLTDGPALAEAVEGTRQRAAAERK